MTDSIDKIVSLAKRRGFVYPNSEIYGGLANAWDYGPMGVELKNNIKKLWWDRYVHRRDDVVGLDAALIMNPKVWEASGHLKEFTDPLISCPQCNNRYRADQVELSANGFQMCPNCGQILGAPKQFNLMFKTFIGPSEEQTNVAYFRPETAQAMFVDFKNVLDSTRVTLPFGIAQIGKAFRNEITPGNFIFRTREFEQMEIEYFIPPPSSQIPSDKIVAEEASESFSSDSTSRKKVGGFIPKPTEDKDWAGFFEHWRKEMHEWISVLGIDASHVHELEVPSSERAHYSKRTIDFEYDFPFGRKELYGLAYRGDFDLANHEKASGEKLKYRDPQTGEEFLPHVIEPTWGVDRSFLAVLCDAYTEDPPELSDDSSRTSGESKRVYLKLKPSLAPYKAAIFPLLANKPELVKLAREVYTELRKEFYVAWDDRGNIGKRYYAQDEIGTPYCITVDFDSLEKKDVTVRNRDTAKQERMPIEKLSEFLINAIRLPT